MEGTAVLYINDLSGSVNQATAPHLLAENQFKLLVNITQAEIGGVGHRLGTDLYLDLVASAGQVRGLDMYTKTDGTHYFHMVTGGNLYVANEAGGTWTSQESAVWSASSEVDMVNFLNRHYMIGSGATENLRYATETGSTSVVSGSIAGSYLASNGAYLMVVDPATRKAQWSGVGVDTFAAGDYANINGLATGIGAFGIDRPFVVFTQDGYMTVNPATVETTEVAGFGCVSNKSIQTIRGYMIFLGRDGFYQLGLNDSFPMEISRLIRNEFSKDAIFNKIDGTNWSVIGSGSIDSRYFCAVRDLSANVKGYDLNDVVIEYDVAAQTIKCHTFETGGIGSFFAQFINSSGNLDLYAGSYDDKAVYKLFPSGVFTDDTSANVATAVTARLITKDHAFVNENTGVVEMQNVIALHFKYRATSALTIKYSLDGKETYSNFTTLAVTDSDYQWGYAELALGKECKTISLDISGTGEWIIYGIGYEISSLNNTGIILT